MAMTSTVDDFATLLRVTTKTVREYLRQGMPVVREGGKGAGNGALIDTARAIPWVKEHRGQLGTTVAEYLLTQPPEQRNPLRWSVERYHDGVIRMIASVLAGYHRDCAAEWRALGLTDKQMRALTGKLFGAIAVTVLTYKVKQFDAEVRQRADGADLDDLASLYFHGDIRTAFDDTIEIPESIKSYMPD